MNTETYYYGQGRIYLAVRDAITGVPGEFRWVGDVSAFSIKLAVEKVEHKESYSGQRALVRSFPIGKSATIDMTLHQVDTDNLSLTLNGTTTSTSTGTVTAETLPEDLVVGSQVSLANPGVSSLVLTDSTGTPLTLVAGTDYVLDADFGRVTILSLGSYVQPFKAAYSYASRKAVGMFTTGQQNFALRYEGVNLAEGNAPVIADLYKLAPDPLAELALITTGNDVAGMQITGGVLLDSNKPSSGALGQFGSITQVAAA
jgi:hypothetical protein